jgi:glutamate-1-semialdehyde 2,1-aminomutase
VYAGLERAGERLEAGLQDAARDADAPINVSRVASLLTVLFAGDEDGATFARFFHGMLDRGVMLPPSRHEAWFVSAAHGAEELDATLHAARAAFAAVMAVDGR